MQILFRYPLLIVCSVLLAIVACSDDDVLNGGIDEGKTPIELAAGVAEGSFAAPAVRTAVVTNGEGKTLRAFNQDTRLFFVVKAEDVRHTVGLAKWGLNYATAEGSENPADDSRSNISFPDNYLYWDDAYARDSKVSVYSMAAANSQSQESAKIGGKVISTTNKKFDFSNVTNTLDIKWTIGRCDDGDEVAENEKRNYQNVTTVGSQDLVFSNNIQGDNTLRFNNTETGKFDKGHLIYYHALSKLTVKIICGEGFKGDGTDFQFTNTEYGQNNSFSIKDFYHTGTLNIGDGTYKDLNTRTFSSIYLSQTNPNHESNPYYTLEALVFPGTDMSASGGEWKDMFSFVIDHNRYDISRAKLYEALKNGGTNDVNTILDGGKLKAGYNYEFTFTVGKTKIEKVTAKVADWEKVEAENQYPSNAHVVLSLEDRGEVITENAHIYRAAERTDALIPDHDITKEQGKGYNWAKKYEQPNEYNHATKTLAATWYWPDNKTFYHFRAVAPTTVTVVPEPATPQNSDADCYVELTAKENYTDAEGTPHSYTDVRWGAPFFEKEPSDPTSNTEKFDYGPVTNGFDGLDPDALGYEADKHQIFHAIGATDYGINLIMFHAMSEVTINVVSVAGDAQVAVDGVKIQLQNIYTAGKLMMGNGLVVGTGDKKNYDFQGSSSTWTYGAIPQDLSGVLLDIKTTDGNHYKVDMGRVISTSVTNENLKNPYTGSALTGYNIDRWYPGFKYVYTFKLSKAEVQLLKCTILEWEKVVAGDDNVQIQ